MQTKFMIKYGEKEHLQQIIDGKLRFVPSQTYIKLEETQHNKGQGDLLEGRMKINCINMEMRDRDTHEVIEARKNQSITISIQDVKSMPIFCLSQYESNCIKEVNGQESIVLTLQELENIKKDFPNASYALIVLEPEKFIKDIQSSIKHKIECNKIQYYDYDINTLQMYMFLTTGSTEVKTDSTLYMTYENRYRHLLCKDIAFKDQHEYRFIVVDKLITEPKFYPFSFNSRYMLVSIDKLETPLVIE